MSENKLMKTLKIGNSPTFEICDATARNDVTQLRGDISNLQDLGLIIKNGVVYDRWEEK